jgi:hypothetical protein
MSYWFLSFREAEKNLNLGVCVVQAEDEESALDESWLKKVNPGGEVLFAEMTEEEFKSEELELDRLYSRQEMKDLGYGWIF